MYSARSSSSSVFIGWLLLGFPLSSDESSLQRAFERLPVSRSSGPEQISSVAPFPLPFGRVLGQQTLRSSRRQCSRLDQWLSLFEPCLAASVSHIAIRHLVQVVPHELGSV